MKASFPGVSAIAGRAHLAAALGLLLALFAAGSASADLATPEQKRASATRAGRCSSSEEGGNQSIESVIA